MLLAILFFNQNKGWFKTIQPSLMDWIPIRVRPAWLKTACKFTTSDKKRSSVPKITRLQTVRKKHNTKKISTTFFDSHFRSFEYVPEKSERLVENMSESGQDWSVSTSAFLLVPSQSVINLHKETVQCSCNLPSNGLIPPTWRWRQMNSTFLGPSKG